MKGFENVKWKSTEKGDILGYHEGKEVYQIEKDLLTDPDRIYQFKKQPGINIYDFFVTFLKACENAKIKTITLKLRD